MNILCGDTESTGLMDFKNLSNLENQPHICQLGLELTDETEKVMAEINILIKPNGWTIPAEATAVHGITTEMCEKYGITIERALSVLNGYAQIQDCIFLAHNKSYDLNLIEIEYKRLGKTSPLAKMKQVCTMEATTDLLKLPGFRGKYKWPRLEQAYEWCFGVKLEGGHDALIDTRACRKVFFHLKNKNLIKI